MLETQDMFDFSITAWYEKFKALTVKTIIVKTPMCVLAKFKNHATDLEVQSACTEEYLNQLKNAILSFGGEAFVKDNWHAPRDARFLSLGHLLKVTCVKDIFLYLTASELINHDFTHDKYDNFCISLKKWINIHPASEFRCVVVNNVLRGITPRDWPTFYAHFCEDGPKIISTIQKFFDLNIKNKFARSNFVFDLILNFPEDVLLIDFNPLNSVTELYAFHWKEIQVIISQNSIDEVPPVFRYLEKDVGIVTKMDPLYQASKSID